MHSNQQHLPITKIIIPIAGHGTRMFPASKVIPKALFPVLDPNDNLCKPILLVIIEHAVQALLSEQPEISIKDIQICIVLQENQKPLIEEFFFAPCPFSLENKSQELKDSWNSIQNIAKQLTFIVQKEQLGFGHAVLCCEESFITDSNEAFLVLLGDHIYTSRTKSGMSCLQYMIRAFKKYQKGVVSLATISEKDMFANGVLKIGDILESENNGEAIYTSLLTTIEKPTQEQSLKHHLYLTEKEMERLNITKTIADKHELVCYFGIDILTCDVFKNLTENWKNGLLHNGEVNLRDAMRPMIESGNMIGVYVKETSRHDTGMPFEYWQSLQQFYNNRRE
nr:unnamed protein product [Naegleria fowleri]